MTDDDGLKIPDGGFLVSDAGPSNVRDAARPVIPDGTVWEDEVVVFAHSRDTLYSFDPQTHQVREVGVFHLPDSEEDVPQMLDLAVDKDGNMFTASAEILYSVNSETAELTEIGSFQIDDERLYALTFLAVGEYSRTSETLVGATNAGAYYKIDPHTARATFLGQYPDEWLSSGDIVSIEGLGTYATVKRSDFPSDVLVQMFFSPDGSSQAIIKGPIQSDEESFRQVFGVGYWGRVLYGFTASGQLIEINRDNGRGTLVTEKTGTDEFWGAGVTTRAPILY